MYKYLNKGISTPVAIGIILVLVILVGGVIYWQYYRASEIEDKTANWNVYRDNEYNYEVRYPTDWRIANDIMEWLKDNYFESQVMITNLSPEEEKDYIRLGEEYIEFSETDDGSIDFPEIPGGKTIISINPVVFDFEYIKSHDFEDFKQEASDIRYKKTKEGLEITQFKLKTIWNLEFGLPEQESEKALIPYLGSKTFWGKPIKHIQISMDNHKGKYEKEIFNQILYTFRFIEGEKTTEEKEETTKKEEVEEKDTDWETYRNYEHEFEIKYPVGWHIEKNKGKFPNRDEKFDIIENEWIGIGILCESRPDNLNWKEWLETKGIIEYEEFTQDSLEGIKVVERSKVAPEDIFLSNKNKICGFVLFFQSEEPPGEEFEEKEEEGKDIFNQMLSTFRFLD